MQDAAYNFPRIPLPRTRVNKPKLAHLEDAPLSLRCYSFACDIKTASMGRGREARPIEERGTL